MGKNKKLIYAAAFFGNITLALAAVGMLPIRTGT